MIYSDSDLNTLRQSVSRLLSKKRFMHTLGVEKSALELGSYFLPECISELRAAALLHDIAKELSEDQINDLISLFNFTFNDNEIIVPEAHHSFIAPLVIKRDFPTYATDSILSSVYSHTICSSVFDTFDLIIFISDFVEDGRIYESCIKTRQYLFDNLSLENSYEENLKILYTACILSIDYTEKLLKTRGKTLHPITEIAKKKLISLI